MTEGWRGETGKRSLGMACGDVVLKLSKSQLSNSYKHASIYEPTEAAWKGKQQKEGEGDEEGEAGEGSKFNRCPGGCMSKFIKLLHTDFNYPHLLLLLLLAPCCQATCSSSFHTHTHTCAYSVCVCALQTFEIAFALLGNALSMRRLPFSKFIIIARQ